MRIGIDAGGTFTDFVVVRDSGAMESFKLPSNPQNPASVILEGIQRIGGNKGDVVHGSTVATNALLERKGARTAFVTTAGFEELLAIGRQNRPELYNLTPVLPRPLVTRDMCFGADERILFDGSIERPLIPGELRSRLAACGAEAIAICLLHSCQNDTHERELLEALSGLGYVYASCDVSPEFREFERASTTVINAYVGPLMDRYLGELARGCPWPVAVMQSNGGLLTASEARSQAVRTILSGPAGGIVGAVEIARQSGYGDVLTFDMGGTSTDVALAGAKPRLTTEARVDGFPVRVPMLDINTVGAGGGSIAWVDPGGSLQVGPQSAGAVPGPACYGTGEAATVTDAHVVLGRIAPEQLVGGEMKLDTARALAAVTRIGAAIGLHPVAAAAAIVRVANSNMERAIRAVSIERGEDPREFPLVAFGGCGGLHACEIAEELGVRTVIVPRLAGALSALGMLLADRVRDYSLSVPGATKFEKAFRTLEQKARKDLRGAKLERSADVRYAGQSYELTVPWGEDFHAAHHRAYGYSDPGRPTEIVTLRVRAVNEVKRPGLDAAAERSSVPSMRRVWLSGAWRNIKCGPRSAFRGRAAAGPAVIVDYGSTTLMPAGWRIQTDKTGSLLLTR
ncbi:MAG: 5-oxoprolinase (ATP-hydrolyzing) [Bryobacterales bacterium]|nr:5-oxoprolinase (ATP-hydrolyzing) [Bryobacterales bacterium]